MRPGRAAPTLFPVLQGFRAPRVVGLLLATVVLSTVAHRAAQGHVTAGAVVVLAVLTAGPAVWLGWERRPLWVALPAVTGLQVVWHVGLGLGVHGGSAPTDHHGRRAGGRGSVSGQSWGDLLPDVGGWAMVATHAAAALLLLLGVQHAESVVSRLLSALCRTAVRLLVRPRPLPRRVAMIVPVCWRPFVPVGLVEARRPRRRGPPAAVAA